MMKTFLITLVLLLGSHTSFAEPLLNAELLANIKMREDFNPKRFLLIDRMPPVFKLIKENAKNPHLAFSQKQLQQVEDIRSETKSHMRKVVPKLKKLERSIVEQVHHGDDPDLMRDELEALAALKVQASINQFHCIQSIKEVLTPRQNAWLFAD